MARQLTDATQTHEDARRDSDRAQIIYLYEAKDGSRMDYCRETAPSRVRTHPAAAAWAQENFDRLGGNKHVDAFRVEFW